MSLLAHPARPPGHGGPFLFRARLGLYWDHHQNDEPRDDAPLSLLRPITPPPLCGHLTIAVSALHDCVNAPRRERPRIMEQVAATFLSNNNGPPSIAMGPLLSPPRTRSRAVRGSDYQLAAAAGAAMQ